MAKKWEDGSDLLGYWYMAGSEGYDFRRKQTNRAIYDRNMEWVEERRFRNESMLPPEEEYLLHRMRIEKEEGVLWICRKCGAEYRVKTPFRKLYCSNENCGPQRLKSYRFLHVGLTGMSGCWIFEDER